VNIIDALDDPDLFQPFFRGNSWGPWRSFLKALFAIPPAKPEEDAILAEAEMAWYRAHTGREEWPGVPFKEACLIIGRRGGNSRQLALIAVFLACFKDYSPFLAPGEVATIAVIAADRRQARSIFRFARGLLSAVPLLEEMVESETSDTIVLNNRVVIEIATASFRVTRGYTFAAVLLDEVAYFRDETSANPDEEILKAIRPGMATIPDSILLMASSPYRRKGVLWTTFQRHYAKDSARVLVVKAATLEMNPALDPAIVAEAYEDDPDSAASEYGAEFRSDLADFVPREVVEAAIQPGRFELPYISSQRYVAFMDPAGGSGGDSMTLAIAHSDKDGVVLDCIRERKPPFSPEEVVKEFAAVIKTYRLSRVTGDRWGGEFVREPFRNLGVTYELSEKPKSTIYQETLPLLNARKVELLDNPRLVKQLISLERRTARGGRDSIDHPPSQNDDVANAVCGALLLCGGRKPMRINADSLAAIGPSPPPGGWRGPTPFERQQQQRRGW
jgi:hypothetical protein